MTLGKTVKIAFGDFYQIPGILPSKGCLKRNQISLIFTKIRDIMLFFREAKKEQKVSNERVS